MPFYFENKLVLINPELLYADYQDSTKKLKNYMERQRSFVAGKAGTFKEMKLKRQCLQILSSKLQN